MTGGLRVVTALADRLRAQGDSRVELRETHMSWVLLTPDRAYKLKKPVRFGFLDLREPDARRRACEEEVRVNQALAAGVVLGVRPVVRDGDGAALGDGGEPVDWVVEMRRFDEDRTMAALVRRHSLRREDVAVAARRIAAFHATAAPARPDGWAAAVARTWNANLGELESDAGRKVGPARIAAARRFIAAFANRRGADLDRRARQGSVVDGHGDLRAEHVLLEGGAVTIVDRLEFDADLRRVDVADDLAFLVMDLHALGAGWAADELVDAYREAGGDPGDAGLIAAFAAYRAQVRAKVGLLRADQLPAPQCEQARASALELMTLAERFAWRARGTLVLVVAGPPASGKSTVAAELAEAGDLPVLSSDLVRRELLGLAPGERAPQSAYAPTERRRIYAALGERAAGALRFGSVVVDATFGEPELRDAFLQGLQGGTRQQLRVIVCDAPLQVRVERARRRAAAGGAASDAGPDVVRAVGDDIAELPVAPEHRVVVPTTGPPGDAARRVAAWLDDDGVR